MIRNSLLLGVLFAAGCDFTVTEPFAIDELCGAIWSCYEFSDEQQCVDTYFEQGCNDESAYFSCMEPCVSEPCGTTLDDCELTCFRTHCNPDVLR